MKKRDSEKIIKLLREYKEIEELMDSPWGDCTKKLSECYGKMGRIKVEMYNLLDEKEGGAASPKGEDHKDTSYTRLPRTTGTESTEIQTPRKRGRPRKT